MEKVINKIEVVYVDYSGMRWEADVEAGSTIQEAMDNLLNRHNVRKTSKDNKGRQRGVIETPFGKTRVTTGTTTRTLI